MFCFKAKKRYTYAMIAHRVKHVMCLERQKTVYLGHGIGHRVKRIAVAMTKKTVYLRHDWSLGVSMYLVAFTMKTENGIPTPCLFIGLSTQFVITTEYGIPS